MLKSTPPPKKDVYKLPILGL